jgi:hypothetical protein
VKAGTPRGMGTIQQLAGIINWCGDVTGPGADVGSSFKRADRGGPLSLPGPGLCTGDTVGMTALGMQGLTRTAESILAEVAAAGPTPKAHMAAMLIREATQATSPGYPSTARTCAWRENLPRTSRN